MEWLVVILMGVSIFNFNEAKGLKERVQNVEIVALGTVAGGAAAVGNLAKRVDAIETREAFREDKKLREAVDKSIKKIEKQGSF